MLTVISFYALVALLSRHVSCQTPIDFQPGTLVNLGVTYPAINVNPVGSLLQSLDRTSYKFRQTLRFTDRNNAEAQTAPVITVPTSSLVGPNGQVDPNQRFMVFMIDEDVVQQGIRTTFLHWLQPDMAVAGPAVPAAGGIMPPSAPGSSTSSALAQSMAAGMSQLAVAPPQRAIAGANTTPPTAVGQTDYLPPGPPPGPPHRYVYVLYAQPQGFTVPQCFQNVLSVPGNPQANIQNRLGFDINQFIAASNVRTRPIAGSYLRAQNPQPGPLDAGATAQGIINAMCPGVAPAGAVMPGKMKRWIVR